MWEAILQGVFGLVQFFYNLCGDWGLAIIIITVIFRLLVAPLMHKQAKSSYTMQKIQPKINELQEKYKNDQVRLSQEMQKIYADAHFNPLAGCVPMLIQMPVFIALFQVLRSIDQYIGQTASNISFYQIVPDLIKTPSQAFNEGFLTFVPYIVLVIVFAGATFFPMVQQQLKNKDNPQGKTTLIMAAVMSVMMVFIAWTSPAGVLLFWGVSSLIGIAQNQFTMARCKKADQEKEERELELSHPYDVDVIRKVRKARPKKKK